MTPSIACPLPLDQGEQATCAAHAFCQILLESLRLKYGVVIKPETAVTVVKTICPRYGGIDVKSLCQKCRELPLESMKGKYVIKAKVACKEVGFDDAFKITEHFHGTPQCLITYNIDGRGHGVAAFDVMEVPERRLVCVNSWGDAEPYVYRNRNEVTGAFYIEVDICEKTVRDQSVKLPQLTELYKARVKEEPARQQIEKLKVKNGSLKIHLENAKLKATDLSMKNIELRERAEAAEAELGEAHKRCQGAERQVENKKEDVRLVKEDLRDAVRKSKGLDRQVRTLKTEKQELVEAQLQKDMELGQERVAIRLIKKDLQDAIRKSKELNRQMRTLKTAHKTYKVAGGAASAAFAVMIAIYCRYSATAVSGC